MIEQRYAETRGLVRDLTTVLEKRNGEIKRLRVALEHYRSCPHGPAAACCTQIANEALRPSDGMHPG